MFDCNTFKEEAFIHFTGYYSAIQRAIIYYVVDHPKVGKGFILKKLPICNTFTDKRHLLILVALLCQVGKGFILKKLPICNTFTDKRHLLILVAITLPSKELQFCYFTMW